MQFKEILVVLRDSVITAPGGERALKSHSRREIGRCLIVADAPPLEAGFVEQVWVHHNGVCDLNGIFLVICLVGLFGKIQRPNASASLYGPEVVISDRQGVAITEL